MKIQLKCCLALALCGMAANAAPLWGDNGNPQGSINSLPMTTPITEIAAAITPMAVFDNSAVRLAGLAVSLPALDGASWREWLAAQEDTLKVLQQTAAPVIAAVAAPTSFLQDIPVWSIVAFAGGIVFLIAGAVFGGALLKLTMAEAKRTRGMRRRYAR